MSIKIIDCYCCSRQRIVGKKALKYKTMVSGLLHSEASKIVQVLRTSEKEVIN